MWLRPVALGTREADVVAQQQLGDAVARAHQIAAQVLPGADQIAQALGLDARNRDRVQFARDQKPRQALGVAPVGLDAIRRPTRDHARRADQTTDPGGLESAREREAGRPGLIRRADRTRQPRHELRHVRRAAPPPPTPPPPPAPPDSRRRRSSPEAPSMTAATVPLTCTSNATNVLACAMVGTPMIAVRAQAAPEP